MNLWRLVSISRLSDYQTKFDSHPQIYIYIYIYIYIHWHTQYIDGYTQTQSLKENIYIYIYIYIDTSTKHMGYIYKKERTRNDISLDINDIFSKDIHFFIWEITSSESFLNKERHNCWVHFQCWFILFLNYFYLFRFTEIYHFSLSIYIHTQITYILHIRGAFIKFLTFFCTGI